MTDNAINDKYKIPYEKLSQIRVENNNFTLKVGQGNPTITTLRNVSFNENTGDYVYSPEKFNVSTLGLFISCGIGGFFDPSDIPTSFYVGGWNYYSEISNNQIRAWSPDGAGSYTSYDLNQEYKYAQYCDGKNVYYYLDGEQFAVLPVVTSTITDYLWFGYENKINTNNVLRILNIACCTLGSYNKDGNDGYDILNGTGKPCDEIGVAGDFYYNTSANTLYGRKRGLGGSLFFGGVEGTGSYLAVPPDNDFVLGTGDFTIEWFQYLKNQLPYGRVFSINSRNIGVSIENDNSDGTQTLIVWVNGNSLPICNFNFLYKWVHIALVRINRVFSVFINGLQVFSIGNLNYDITNSGHELRIGNEEGDSDTVGFKGFITNFRWTKGYGLYTSTFLVPTRPLRRVNGTRLLLNVEHNQTYILDASGYNKTVINNNNVVSWDALTPFRSDGYWCHDITPLQLNDPPPQIVALNNSSQQLLWDFKENGYTSIIIYISCTNDLSSAPANIAQILVNYGKEGPQINQLGGLPANVSVIVIDKEVYLTSVNTYNNTAFRVVPIV